MSNSKIAELEKKLAVLDSGSKKGSFGTEKVDILNQLANLHLFSAPPKTERLSLKALDISHRLGYRKGTAESFRLLGASYAERGELDKGLEYSLKALNLCEEVDEKTIMAQCCVDIGLVYKDKGEYDKALGYQNRALQLANQLRWDKATANTYLNIGLIHKLRGDFDTALEYYFKSLEVNERIEDFRGIAVANLNIGLVYRHQDDLDQALQYQNKALRMFVELGDKRGMARCHGNIGLIYTHQEDFEKALYHQQKAQGIYAEMNDETGLAITGTNIGIIYTRMGDSKKALEYQLDALDRNEKIGNEDSIVSTLVNIGVSYGKLGKDETALGYFQKALRLAQEIGVKKWEMLAYMNVSFAWEKLGDSVKALSFYKKYSDLRHKIYSEESAERIARMRVRYETERKEAETEIYRLKTVELERLVGERTSELLRSAKLATIGVFAGGIAHQINNPLAIMSSTSTLIARRLEKNPDIPEDLRADLADHLDILNAQIQRAHKTASGLLAFAREKDARIQPSNINLLVNDVLQFLLQRHKSTDLTLNLNLGKKLPKAQVDQEALRQVLTNIIQNSIEAMGGKGDLGITTSLNSNNNIEIDVSDSGSGVPLEIRDRIFDPLFTTKSKGTGLGLSLAAVLLERFEGKIHLAQSRQGARFIVEVPCRKTEEK